MRRKGFVIATSGAPLVALVAAGAFAFGTRGASASQTTYDINTLAGKVASVHGTAGLQIRFSAFIEEEAEEEASPTPNTPPINPPFVLSSPLDGSSVAAPNVTVNQDTAGGPQNETAIAVDPNSPNRVGAAASDYATRPSTSTLIPPPSSNLPHPHPPPASSTNPHPTPPST